MSLWALALLASLVAAREAHAQGTISDPPATFTRPVSAFDSMPVASFTGVSADPMADHVFEMGWWYRIAGGTAEKFFPAPSTQSYVSNTSTITWNDVDNRGAFRAVESGVVTNGGGPSGQVTFSLTLTNLSATTPLSIDVFNLADLDLGGTTEADSATLLAPNDRIGLTDGADSAEYGAEGADAFLVLAYQGSSGLPDVRARLSDAVLDNFDNTGLPFGPGDFSAGFQWTTTVIPPSGSATFVAGIAVNMALALPAGSSTTTSSTLLGATTSTTLAFEVCTNCIDDDGNGLVDDRSECCGEVGVGGIRLRRGSLRAVAGDLAAVKLKGTIPDQPALSGGLSPTEDVMIQLRHSQDDVFDPNTQDLVCAYFPAATFVRRHGNAIFRDPDRTLPSARGIDSLILARRRNGALKMIVRAKRASLTVPGAGWIEVLLALRDPATVDTSRCVGIAGAFRATKKGLRFPP